MQTVVSSFPFDNENRKEKQNTQFLSACQAAMCQKAEEKKMDFLSYWIPLTHLIYRWASTSTAGITPCYLYS